MQLHISLTQQYSNDYGKMPLQIHLVLEPWNPHLLQCLPNLTSCEWYPKFRIYVCYNPTLDKLKTIEYLYFTLSYYCVNILDISWNILAIFAPSVAIVPSLSVIFLIVFFFIIWVAPLRKKLVFLSHLISMYFCPLSPLQIFFFKQNF